jgi:hypothetical protein
MTGCVLKDEGAMKRTMFLHHISKPGGSETFMIELDKAKIFGFNSSVEETRLAISHAWDAAWHAAHPVSGWTSGPMAGY